VDDELKARIAREHGLARRADAVSVTLLAEEWGALKAACAHVLARHGFVGPLVDDTMRRIEVLVDDAIGYTLRGYYAQELDTLRGRGLERRDSALADRRQGGDRRARAELERRDTGDRRHDAGWIAEGESAPPEACPDR
jgi:hypothetical protein